MVDISFNVEFLTLNSIFSGESSEQQHWIEVYLTLMTTALEDEYFICDYNERYNVSSQNEMFSNCAEVYPLIFVLI